MPREIRDWRNPRSERATVPLEKLMSILENMYGTEQAKRLYDKLTKEDDRDE